MIGGGSLDSELTHEEWLETMSVIFEALTTGGQKIYVNTAGTQYWGGIHVAPGTEASIDRTFTFRIEGPK